MNDSSPGMNGNASDWAVSEPGGSKGKGKDEAAWTFTSFYGRRRERSPAVAGEDQAWGDVGGSE